MPVAVVAGALANRIGKGGEAWVRLSWALGLARLGFEVHLLELIDPAALDGRPLEGSPEAAYVAGVTSEVGLAGRATLLCGREGTGLGHAGIRALLRETDLLVNVSGHAPLAGPAGAARVKLYLDVDPGYTQIWAERGALALAGHDAHATVGLAVGTPGCAVPTAGLDWLRTFPPVVLDCWPSLPAPSGLRFTTVASWRGGYGRLEHHGRLLGQKAHELRRFLDLPRAAGGHPFEIALAIDEGDRADREALLAAGWRLLDPRVAATPAAYRSFVQGSGAELSVAQGAYVELATGWFSDRTAAYLASGRPALVQATGIPPRHLPARGLVTFSTLAEAVAGVEAIASERDEHAVAAREFARRHLDSDVVIGRLLERLPLR